MGDGFNEWRRQSVWLEVLRLVELADWCTEEKRYT